MVKAIEQYNVFWISLVPTRGREIAKTRPCVVVSPDELNHYLRTVVVIPITSTVRNFPWRVMCCVANKNGSIATDQIRSVDKDRLGAKMGRLSEEEIADLKDVLQKMLVD